MAGYIDNSQIYTVNTEKETHCGTLSGFPGEAGYFIVSQDDLHCLLL
jgi:hypothetical protein